MLRGVFVAMHRLCSIPKRDKTHAWEKGKVLLQVPITVEPKKSVSSLLWVEVHNLIIDCLVQTLQPWVNSLV